MTYEERRKIKEMTDPVVDEVNYTNAYFNWSWPGCGFGQLSFGYDQTTKTWTCDNEGMGSNDVRRLLHAFAEHVADQLAPVIEAERDRRAT